MISVSERQNYLNILFLTLGRFPGIQDRTIYSDLLRQFWLDGHKVYVVCQSETRFNQDTVVEKSENCEILRVKTGNVTKTSAIKKGFATLALDRTFGNGIKKHFGGIHFDLILYSTPPITLTKTISALKKKNGAKTYLLLKDIFPQNAADLGMMPSRGVKGFLFRYFRNIEKKLYALSDRIGCMSQANVDYILKHNTEISPDKVEISPNCIDIRDVLLTEDERNSVRKKYGLPTDKKIFIYGGNLGKPQGIPFITECLKKLKNHPEAFLLIIGSGTEYPKLKAYFDSAEPSNMKLIPALPKDEYDKMIASCDIGMIFLDYRFTIPNFPSRLLTYMQAGLPVLCCTDENSDIGKVVTEGGFGWYCPSNNSTAFAEKIDEICKSDCNMKETELKYLKEHYSVQEQYKIISRIFDAEAK